MRPAILCLLWGGGFSGAAFLAGVVAAITGNTYIGWSAVADLSVAIAIFLLGYVFAILDLIKEGKK